MYLLNKFINLFVPKYKMVWCSKCGHGIITSFNCNVLGTTHLKIGLNAYLLNDSYSSNKNHYADHEAFQIFCVDCFNNGHYFTRLIQKYPSLFQRYSQASAKQLTLKHEKQMQEHKHQLILALEQFKKAQKDLQEQNTLEGLYKRFQARYKEDEKKMISLQSFKKFGKEMALKDNQFKKKLEDLYLKMEKEYLNSSIIRIQNLFSIYVKEIDHKIKLCEQDIQKIKDLQSSTLKSCSSEKSLFCKQNLINQGRLRSIKILFQNQIICYQKLLSDLRKFKNSGVVEFNLQEFQLSKMSDAQMHQNLWEFNIFKK